MDNYARSFQQGLRRPILLLLLLVMSFAFYVTTRDTSQPGGYTVSHAQSSTSGTAWTVKSFIWSRKINAWARTNCTMTIGGQGSSVRGAPSQTDCSNTGDGKLSFLQYYHDTDPDDTTPKDRTDDVYGKIKGQAWSPFYGVIHFDLSHFPSGVSCYGLTGDARQARIRRKADGGVELVGCAYVPLLREHILLNRADAVHAAPAPPEWEGVRVTAVEDTASAYLVLRGCAWSSNGLWSFGLNPSSAADANNCLPSGHGDGFKKALPEGSRVGTPGNVSVTINPTRTSLKIGQEVGYQYSCPSGYNTPKLTIGSRVVSSALLSLFRGFYREIFTDPVSTLLLTCTDGTNIFTSPRSSLGAITSSIQNAFFISSFTVTPSVLTEGGFVSFGGSVSNQGGFASTIPTDNATGSCDNTKKNGCINGIPNETIIEDDEVYYRWRCDGVGGAAHSGVCQIPKELSLSQEEIVADGLASLDRFGRSVAIDGDTALIGADGDDTGGADAGAAYIFTRSDTGWSQQAKIVADGGSPSDYFGGAVAIDGDTALIGAVGDDTGGADAGAAHIFTRSDAGWGRQEKLVGAGLGPSDRFGRSVAIDGDTALIGADGDDTGGADAGAVYIFTRSNTGWSQEGSKIQATDKQGDDHFGGSVAMDGDTLLIGAAGDDTRGADAGAAYIFTRSDTGWSQEEKLIGAGLGPADRFGHSVAIDGDTVFIGAVGDDVGGNNAGAVYIFTRSNTGWSQEAKIHSKDQKDFGRFGRSVAIDGDTALIGAEVDGSAGSAYIFTRSNTGWSQEGDKMQVGDNNRGSGDHYRPIDISGGTLLIGADGDGDSDEGSVFFYTNPTGRCDNTSLRGCLVGTPNDAAVPDISAYQRWRCDGVNGAKNSGACQFSAAAVPGNEGYCTITNKVTKQEVQRFDVDGVNVTIPGSDLAVRDAVYDLKCRYKSFKPDKSFIGWESVSATPVTVKVLPRGVSERDVSGTVDSPVFSASRDTVSVSIPSGAAMVYVFRISNSSLKQITADSLFKIFVDRSVVELDSSETVDELKARLFEPAVRSRVVVVGSRSGGITKSVVIGKSLIAVARTGKGVWSQQVVFTLSGNGICNERALNRCVGGTFSDVDDSYTHYQWECKGVDGGTDSPTCSINKSSVAAGVCDETFLDRCSSGTFRDVADSDTRYRWECDGIGGGKESPVCSIAMTSVIAGDCDETVINGCSDGTLDDISDSDTHYLWKCNGIAGGQTPPTCSRPIPIDGGWTDWTPLPTTQTCGSTFSQTRSCTNPAPAHDGADCPGLPDRDGIIGIQCPAREVCKDGGCVERIDCPSRVAGLGNYWSAGGVSCLTLTPTVTLPNGLLGERETINSKPAAFNFGSGSTVYECGDSGWAVLSRTCSR